MLSQSIKEKTPETIEHDLFEVAEITLRYIHKSDPKNYPQITCSEHAHHIFMEIWDDASLDLFETMYMLLLNRSKKVLGAVKVSQGGMSHTIVDPKLIFATALKAGASEIILAHNHPSGNLSASEADRKLSHKIKSGCEILDIEFLDHLIITRHGYTSFADENLFLPY